MSKDTLEVLSMGEIMVDREFVYTLMTALSELHGRYCQFIGTCGDMEFSTKRAECLEDIVHTYNDAESVAARIDNREAQTIEV
jgi:hypothetical protein